MSEDQNAQLARFTAEQLAIAANSGQTLDPNLAKSTRNKGKKRGKGKTKDRTAIVEHNDDGTESDGSINLGLGPEALLEASTNLDGALSHPIPCRYSDKGCKETFRDLTLADIHARHKHGESSANNLPPLSHLPPSRTLQPSSSLPESGPALVSCPACSTQVAPGQPMLTHIFTVHPTLSDSTRASPQPQPPLAPVKCVLCQASLGSEADLVAHLNQLHGLPHASAPSNSFHAPYPGLAQRQQHQQLPGGQQPTGGDMAQVINLLQQLLPQVPRQSQHPHQPQSLLLPSPPLLAQQGPTQPFQTPAYPVGFHPASLFPSSQSRCNSETKLKSGLDRSVAPNAAVFVLWPHEAFDRVSGQRDIKNYGDLSVGALAAGMIRSLMYLPEFASAPVNIQMQHQHMSNLFHSIVATNNLQAALEFEKSILLMVERGQLRWEPEFAPLLQSMQINYLASVRANPSSSQLDSAKGAKKGEDTQEQDKNRRFKEARDTFCSAYQDGSCPHAGHHDSKQHFCKFCWGMRSQKLGHVSTDCPNDPWQP